MCVCVCAYVFRISGGLPVVLVLETPESSLGAEFYPELPVLRPACLATESISTHHQNSSILGLGLLIPSIPQVAQ